MNRAARDLLYWKGMRKLTHITLGSLMQQIRRAGGQFQFSHVTSEPGITYRDPAGNYLAVYERMDWGGKVHLEIYRACDPADYYTGDDRSAIVELTKPRTLGGRERFAVECAECGGTHVPDDDCCEPEWSKHVNEHSFERERWGYDG